MKHSNISLAQWALVEEIQKGKWTTLDFPRIARTDFEVDGIEFVNTLFAVPTATYLDTLKKNAADNNIAMVLIMVDDEGDGCEATTAARKQFAINHRKWVDIAHYLGCKAIRTNCRGTAGIPPAEALRYATESYHMLLDYAAQANMEILVENHGGFSNDADWMIQLMNAVNNPLFGTYPDWREPAPDFDNYNYLLKTLPFAKGMSYRNQPDDLLTIKMMTACKEAGYTGWYGIESNGRAAIIKGKKLLQQHVLEKELH